jgi:GH24 family phage-related lysozyme (muramidase)
MRIHRRLFVTSGAVLLAVTGIIRPSVAEDTGAGGTSIGALEVRFDQLLARLQARADLLSASRVYREGKIFALAEGRALAARPSPSKTPISMRATDLIVACEVTSQKKYTHSYQRATWPGGASGATIGVGYDIGYVTIDWLRQDWQDYVSDEAIANLGTACGVTGRRARQLIPKLGDVVIDWTIADRQFLEQVQPRYVGETENALPNTNLLNPDCLGALVSLVYNRGASFSTGHNPKTDPLDRFREMRAIKAHMQSKEFSSIPAEIRGMKRLWDPASMAGLVQRRELEAALFELGIKQENQS